MVLPSSLPVPWLQTPRNVDTMFTQLLQFLHTASDWTGTLVVEGIHSILPSASHSNQLGVVYRTAGCLLDITWLG